MRYQVPGSIYVVGRRSFANNFGVKLFAMTTQCNLNIMIATKPHVLLVPGTAFGIVLDGRPPPFRLVLVNRVACVSIVGNLTRQPGYSRGRDCRAASLDDTN